ncbi:MAG TPA: OmpA family protein [Chryseosolibacter sp.]|nr:OmpA family protein [Chryseosolibacter sp.]
MKLYPIVQIAGRKKQAFVTGLLVLIFFSSHAQSSEGHLAKADRFFERKDYKSAIISYLEALQLGAGDARTSFKIGVSYLNEEDFGKALGYLEKALSLDPAIDPAIHYHLGMAYQELHRYGEAIEHFKLVKASNKPLTAVAKQKITECSLADSLMRQPANADVTPLSINTTFAEFSPLITTDGNTLIFTSDRSDNDYQIKSNTNADDVYISRKEGVEWSVPQKLSPTINVKLHEAATFLSADSKTLLLFYEEGAGDIYSSTFENGNWTKPVSLNRFINHPKYQESSACLSPDGKKLYFSSNRAGGRGGFDIYVCELGSNGQWGRPANLGSTINSRGDEDTPYVHADGVTLYFSSNGHPTLGKMDIFKSTLKNGKWTPPENLGYPINTSGDDAHFVLASDNKTGYYSRRNGTSGTDIFSVSFNSVATAANTPREGPGGENSSSGIRESAERIMTVLKGTVIDVSNNAALDATITLVDNSNKNIISKIKTGPSGNFQVVIPHGGNYGVTTEANGYLFNSMNFNIPAFEKYQEIDTHILMVKAVVGSKVVLKNVFFDLNQSALKPESVAELENIRALLLQNPGWRIQINGHTDNIGHPTANMALSLKRAEAVVQYLIREGVEATRLRAKGYGSERPIVSNDDEAGGRQINRRTEIEIIE